jgi:hypothetical protein
LFLVSQTFRFTHRFVADFSFQDGSASADAIHSMAPLMEKRGGAHGVGRESIRSSHWHAVRHKVSFDAPFQPSG